MAHAGSTPAGGGTRGGGPADSSDPTRARAAQWAAARGSTTCGGHAGGGAGRRWCGVRRWPASVMHWEGGDGAAHGKGGGDDGAQEEGVSSTS